MCINIIARSFQVANAGGAGLAKILLLGSKRSPPSVSVLATQLLGSPNWVAKPLTSSDRNLLQHK